MGAAVIDLQASYADYQRSKFRTFAKRRLKAAKQRKHSYAKIDAAYAIDQIMEVNASRPERSGRPMLPLYFNRSKFESILREIGNAHVVRCPDGKIVAYALVPNIKAPTIHSQSVPANAGTKHRAHHFARYCRIGSAPGFL
jgi:hypothetical protein